MVIMVDNTLTLKTLKMAFCGSTVSNFLRNCQIDFQSGCASLQSHQQWRSFPLSPHPRQHLLSPEFLIFAILTDVRCNLRVVLICISLMIKDAEQFFSCFSAIQYSSVENSLFSSVPHSLIGLFGSLESNFLGHFKWSSAELLVRNLHRGIIYNV